MAPSHKVYTVTRTDYEDDTDHKGLLVIVGVYASLDSANKAARGHRRKEAEHGLYEDIDEHVNQSGEYACTVHTGEDDRDRFDVEVAEQQLEGHVPRASTPVTTSIALPPAAHGANGPIHSVFGPMMTVPIGIPGALKGSFFTLAGDLWTLSRRSFYNTVKIYGGICPNYHEEADYVVVGANTPHHLAWFADCGIEAIDEKKFFELLRDGVPDDREDDGDDDRAEYRATYPVEGFRILEAGIDGWLSSSSQEDETPPAKRHRV
ncbi:hypothetical protein AC579_5492 [Pseudocercospora musae]|uniref:BRCT domain-containing protein n=1 Tax=Pseudocercospora musae TaxID=113226 RepID=A0A139IPR4_9PEZI|nr:hypothetical protein AC579_5492 [Pseudocercospora musae]